MHRGVFVNNILQQCLPVGIVVDFVEKKMGSAVKMVILYKFSE